MKQERYLLIKQIIDTDYYWDIDVDRGIVKPKRARRMPTRVKSEDEYDFINIVYAGKQHKFYVHQIIAVAGGLDPAGCQLRHINGNIHDNSLSNLELVKTSREVQYVRQEIRRVKTDLVCEKHPRAKLSNDDVAYIKYRLEHKTQVKVLAQLYNVSNMVITRIKLNSTWKQIRPLLDEEIKSYELSDRGHELGLS